MRTEEFAFPWRNQLKVIISDKRLLYGVRRFYFYVEREILNVLGAGFPLKW